MFCPNCGKSNQDDAKLCDGCGADLQGTATQPQSGQQPQQPYQQPQQPYQQPQQPYQQPSTQTSDNTKLFSILSYFGLFFLIGLFADPQNPKVKFHVNQGCILFIVEIILFIIVSILSFLVAFIPYIGWIFSLLLWLAYSAAAIGLPILGIINAVKGEEKQLPVIGQYTIIK